MARYLVLVQTKTYAQMLFLSPILYIYINEVLICVCCITLLRNEFINQLLASTFRSIQMARHRNVLSIWSHEEKIKSSLMHG